MFNPYSYYPKKDGTIEEKIEDYKQRKIKKDRLTFAVGLYRLTQRGFSQEDLVKRYEFPSKLVSELVEDGKIEYNRQRGIE